MDTGFAAVTVNVVEPVFDVSGSAAVIVTVPAVSAVATPLKPAALPIAATDASEDAQVADNVIFCVVKSEYVPMAVNC